MVIQNISSDEKTTDITFTVKRDDVSKTEQILKSDCKINFKEIIQNNKVAKISIVGAGMKTHTGIATRMFTSLAKSKINISMISTSEIKISCVINKNSCKKAISSLHKEFGLG